MDPDTEQQSCVERAAPRDDATAKTPVLGASARDVARAEREVRPRLARGDEARNVRGVVREVAVELEDQLRAVRKRAPESGDIRRPEALLTVAMEDGDEVELACQPVGDLAGPVGRVVVDHEHLHVERLERAHHRLEVLALVVRRQAHRCVRHRGVG